VGTSTDGILFYGYNFSEDTEFPWSEDEETDFESYLAEHSGLHYDPESPDHYEQYSAQQDYIKSLPVVIGTHCSGEYPMYYLAIRVTESTASRGSPKLVKPNAPYVGASGWDGQLTEFAREFELPLPGQDEASEIGWWLASYWSW
jgi:hypothetical protein